MKNSTCWKLEMKLYNSHLDLSVELNQVQMLLTETTIGDNKSKIILWFHEDVEQMNVEKVDTRKLTIAKMDVIYGNKNNKSSCLNSITRRFFIDLIHILLNYCKEKPVTKKYLFFKQTNLFILHLTIYVSSEKNL